MKELSVILIGAGDRGTIYTTNMARECFEGKFRVVGVADPIEQRRMRIKDMWSIPDDKCFHYGQEMLDQPKFADLAVIATSDALHYELAMTAIEKGYHLLLEKPAATTPKECVDIANAAKKKKVEVLVCHVLRYAPFYARAKELLMQNIIGEIQSAVFVEGVGNIHQSHSYVRGNWHNEKESSPMLLAKSCHDIDMIQWLLNKQCKLVQSFGSLKYFTEKNAPSGAPKRCTDGCPHHDTCEYNAIKLYYDDKNNNWFRCAATAKVKPTDEDVREALLTGNYGKCVFHSDNDVVDHQVVNMEFEDGVTVSFSMNAFNKGGRYLRLFGTKGELWANISDKEFSVFSFSDREWHKYPVRDPDTVIDSGHGGGDFGIVAALYQHLAENKQLISVASIDTSIKNHLLVFAAEEARLQKTVVDFDEYLSRMGLER